MHIFLKRILFFGLLFFSIEGLGQNTDSLIIRKIYTEALLSPIAYHNLAFLCNNIGGRLCGSPQADQVVQWTRHLLEGMKPDTVFLQPVTVEHWERGAKETARVTTTAAGGHNLDVCALGSSIGTGMAGLKAEVVEVRNFSELKLLGKDKVEGKIVFFNRAADPAPIYTFEAYGGAVDQRAYGAMQAAHFGAVAVIVRSATLAHDDFPHTGIQHYADSVKPVPAVAVSTNGADSLSRWLKADSRLKLFIRTTCIQHSPALSHNVIAEIRGSEYPNEIITFGGHLDSWDIGQGAHDDGTGVVQSIEVLRLFKSLGLRPKHTIRLVLFMDEEYAQRGGKAYGDEAKRRSGLGLEKHIAAIETDRGGFTPSGFSIDASAIQLKKIQEWKTLLLPYGLWSIEKGGSGVDIQGLKPLGVPLIALVTDSQRYFDYQHAASDTFDKVNFRELQLGSAAMAALIWLIDEKW